MADLRRSTELQSDDLPSQKILQSQQILQSRGPSTQPQCRSRSLTPAQESGRVDHLMVVDSLPATVADIPSSGDSQVSLSPPVKTMAQEPNDLPVVKQEEASTPSAVAASEATGCISVADTELMHIQQSTKEEHEHLLETFYDLGQQTLVKLRSLLVENGDHAEARRILKSIEELQSRTRPGSILIGILGSMGTGKSSAINAVLGEDRLVPTNGMRACTAVATEIAWNNSDDPTERYRAEIEFISADEWLQELRHLFSDLIDADGRVSKDSSSRNTEAGVAFAKIKSIYPHYTKETLAETTADQLADEALVRRLLGTTQHIRAEVAGEFQRQVQMYVDSKEKTTKQEKAQGIRKPLELWPLIKVVRIFTKAEVLASGAVLVDLPGSGDTNEARSTVAERYMKQCDRLWIFAPITRAVDDKVAEKLLGESFKLQLKYDGNYDNVTFICTKTDDIEFAEVADGLGLRNTLTAHTAWKAETRAKLEAQEVEYSQLGKAFKLAITSKRELSSQLEVWRNLAANQDRGSVVFSPQTPGEARKRKRESTDLPANKGPRPIDNRNNRPTSVSNYVDSDEDDDDDSATEGESPNVGKEPLTKEQVQSQIRQLKSEKKVAIEKVQNIFQELSVIKSAMQNSKGELEDRETSFRSMCIQKRNEYSRAAIKDHFSLGIREMDHEAAMQEDASAFDPAQALRDYDEVARSLPVFCISSRVYRQLTLEVEGNDVEDVNNGFRSVEDTEIPRLQDHVIALANSARRIWIRNQISFDSHFVPDEKVLAALRVNLKTMERVLVDAAKKSAQECSDALRKTLFSSFRKASSQASTYLPSVVAKWSAKKEEGGLSPVTYKATVIRDGIFKSITKGEINWNEELAMPLKRKLSHSWEKTFARLIPNILEEFVVTASSILEKFHVATVEGISDNAVSTRVQRLQGQLQTYSNSVKDTQNQYLNKVKDWQREASRQFIPSIQKQMHPAYSLCYNERGRGCTARMHHHIEEHVSEESCNMLVAVTEDLEERLLGLCHRYEMDLTKTIVPMVKCMAVDYTHSISSLPESSIPDEVRLRIAELLGAADADFEAALTAPAPAQQPVDIVDEENSHVEAA